MLYPDAVLSLDMLRFDFCRAWRMESCHWERRVASTLRYAEEEARQ